MKKIGKRSFIKGMFGGLAMAIVPMLPKLPEIPEKILPEPLPIKPTASKFACRDYTFKVTIQEYEVGGTVKYQDLSDDPSCDNCLAEARCMQGGEGFEQYGDGTGRFVPEVWNKRTLNVLYRKMNFTGGKV